MRSASAGVSGSGVTVTWSASAVARVRRVVASPAGGSYDPAMQRCIVGLLGLTCACGFSATPSPGGPPVSDAASDGVVVDGNDAMAANRRRKPITFDPTKVGADQQDFPAWIDLTDTDLAARAQPDGRDIYFTASDGTTRLDHQLARVDLAGHRVTAWVRVPLLSGTAATVIYVNYGDAGAASPQKPAGVFKSSFAAVWHLDDAIPATTIVDATGTHAGTPILTATTQAAGQLGGGLKFTGAMNDRIEFVNPLSGNNVHTISVWVSQAAGLNHTAAIVVVGTGSGGQSRWLHGHYTNSSVALGFYAQDFNPSPAQGIDGAGWTYLTWVFEGANNRSRLYRNGAEIASSPFTPSGGPTINTTGAAGFIGYAPMPAYGANNAYDGTIDELRIASVARSATWIAAEYANQHAPGTFYSVGAEQIP